MLSATDKNQSTPELSRNSGAKKDTSYFVRYQPSCYLRKVGPIKGMGEKLAVNSDYECGSDVSTDIHDSSSLQFWSAVITFLQFRYRHY
jgi:hypothetical protein